MEVLVKWGGPGALGFLIGVFIVTMAEPKNIGGIGILMAVGISMGLVLGAVLRLIWRLVFTHNGGPDADS